MRKRLFAAVRAAAEARIPTKIRAATVIVLARTQLERVRDWGRKMRKKNLRRREGGKRTILLQLRGCGCFLPGAVNLTVYRAGTRVRCACRRSVADDIVERTAHAMHHPEPVLDACRPKLGEGLLKTVDGFSGCLRGFNGSE